MKEFIVKCFRWYEQRNKNGNNFQKKTHKWTFNNFSSFFLPPWNLLCYNSLQIFLFWGSSHSQFDCDAGSYNIIYQVIKYFSCVKYLSLFISVWWPNFLPPPTWGWLTSGWLQPNWSHSCWWPSLHPLQYLKMMWRSIIMDLQGKHLYDSFTDYL